MLVFVSVAEPQWDSIQTNLFVQIVIQFGLIFPIQTMKKSTVIFAENHQHNLMEILCVTIT
jgi:hypothetical protein